MQLKTSSAQAQVVRLGKGCVVGVAGMAAMAPQAAYALTAEDAWQSITSSPVPLACAGVGFVVGAGLVGVVSSGVHKSRVAAIEERLQALEDRLSSLDATAVPKEEQDGAAASVKAKPTHARHAAEPVPASTPSIKVEAADEEKTPRRSSPEGWSSLNDDTHLMPVIARGVDNTSEQRALDLDRTHATEVMRRLDGGTRSRMIERRIPSLDALILQEPSTVEEENDFADPEVFDPEALVDRIMREEIQHREDEAARRFTRANLTVFEGAGASSSSETRSSSHQAHTPTQQYAWSREA